MKRLLLILLLLTILVLSSSLVVAPYNPVSLLNYINGGQNRFSDFGESWASLVDWKNIFTWDNSTYENDWYPVKEWEVQQCSLHLSSELKHVQSPDSTQVVSAISDLSITIQGTKFFTLAKTYEYTAAWYVQPFEKEVNYSIEVLTENAWKPLPDYVDVSANPVTGSSGYYAWNSENDSTQVRVVAGQTIYAVPLVNRR